MSQWISSDVVSPDGSLRVEFEEKENRNGEWLYSPRISDVKSQEVLLDLWHTLWDGAVSFGGRGRSDPQA